MLASSAVVGTGFNNRKIKAMEKEDGRRRATMVELSFSFRLDVLARVNREAGGIAMNSCCGALFK